MRFYYLPLKKMFIICFNTHIQIPAFVSWSDVCMIFAIPPKCPLKILHPIFYYEIIQFFPWRKKYTVYIMAKSHNVPGKDLFPQWRTFIVVFIVMFYIHSFRRAHEVLIASQSSSAVTWRNHTEQWWKSIHLWQMSFVTWPWWCIL